jgi:hypothetical protein
LCWPETWVIRRARLASSPRGHIKVVTTEARATGLQQARDGSGNFAHEQA